MKPTKTNSTPAVSESEQLILRGVSENNLKGLNLNLDHDKLIAITGVSGSGKTTLAFDTIYAEGGRRYIETFSPYTRQFLDRLHKPQLESISGVRPALALEQQNRVNNSRSTVGTVTEVNDYIKVVWSLLAELECPNCSVIVSKGTVTKTSQAVRQYCNGFDGLVLITFGLSISGQASVEAVVDTLRSQGFLRFYNEQSQSVESLDSLLETKCDRHDLKIVVDRFKTLGSAKDIRLQASIRQAFTFGHGVLHCIKVGEASAQYSEGYRCDSCATNFTSPRPSLFSYNSPLGACSECQGFGKVLEIDPDLVVPDRSKTIEEGAIHPWSTPATTRIFSKLKSFCVERDIPIDIPWIQLAESAAKEIFEGAENSLQFRGVLHYFERLKRKRHKMHVRVMLSRYRSERKCSHCSGTRLKPEALCYLIDGKMLPEIWQLPIEKSVTFFENLAEEIQANDPTRIPLGQVLSRLRYLNEIGLSYLTLDRQTRSLSGGESQRVNLTSILGAELVNTTLVLDEPTIGLHARDTQKLISTLHQLKDRGNSVFVVEHDQDVIMSADEVIDIGPNAGAGGGEVVFKGGLKELKKCHSSLTQKYLNQSAELASRTRPTSSKAIVLKGARAHNLKNINVEIPLEQLVLITGVSGSGKSTLINECLFKSIKRLSDGEAPNALGKRKGSYIDTLLGTEHVDDVVLIDQKPIGKSPRSNAATYTKAWDPIRQCLAQTTTAEELALTKSAFSFNVDGGRCPNCRGAGQLRIEMQFLSDVFVECDECGGTRFQEQIRAIKYFGKSVVDFLNMTLEETVEFFKEIPSEQKSTEIVSTLQPIISLGLGYLRLGQPLNTVSGGEAQRIKLASYLNPRLKQKCLFILDEPTTGLHPHNISQLIDAFDVLIANGHSILCIEHNLDVIRRADWIIDLGPGGGEHGGRIVATGTPHDLRSSKVNDSATVDLLQKKNFARKAPFRSKKPSEQTTKATSMISVEGARHHNLKNIDVEIPMGVMNVITGVSGSGKSSLAFDIVFAEGQRRYIDCLSPYARQYIKQLSRADVDRVSNIPPTIAISQKTAPPLGISTLATTTEVYQFLRLLFAKIGRQHCPADGTEISSLSTESLIEMILRKFKGERLFFFAPAVQGRKGFYNDLFQRALRAEITKAKIDGEMVSLEPDLRLERHKLHWISLLVASLTINKKNRDLIKKAVEQTLLLGGGAIEVCAGDEYADAEILSIDRICPECGKGYLPLDPQDFSFRSKRGVCQKCDGRGVVQSGAHSSVECPACGGARLSKIARHVLLEGKRIDELTAMKPQELIAFLEKIQFSSRDRTIAEPILDELTARLRVILSVGLDYISLDRDASSISGGEAQRLRLACALGSPLSGVCYVLDEPSIGLHPSDHEMLMDTLQSLKRRGNTLIVVEHDEDTIRAADYVIDIGPRGGSNGGSLVFEGTPSNLESCKESLTGQSLRERAKSSQKADKSISDSKVQCLELTGARANNLKNINARFPLNALSVVAGVSGAGKSSLVHRCLVPAIVEEFEGEQEREKYYPKVWDSLSGFANITRYIEIDQAPIGKTPTSIPASYLGIYTDIRKIYSSLPDAKAQGWNASHFSFNTGKGKCEICSGRGFIKVPMSFLPDASTLCDSCGGMRYNDQALEVRYQGVNIGETLAKTFTEARQLFSNHRKIVRAIDYVLELGLGYLTLGQPSHTLSGGEAQRIKIAKELGTREAKETLYVLDEPTVGLHMQDVDKLLSVLKKLTELGNTVIVIEHNIDIIKNADHLIELGPQAGDKGGTLVFSGTPYELRKSKKKTKTKSYL